MPSEHQVTAAVGRVQQAEAARLPNFRLGGSLGLNALTLGTLTDGASVVSAVLADIRCRSSTAAPDAPRCARSRRRWIKP